jgi:hypothetical protein
VIELRSCRGHGTARITILDQSQELIGSVVLIIIGVALIALAPAKQPVEKATVLTA